MHTGTIVNPSATFDVGFARALLDQSVSLFLGGEPEAARLILRDWLRVRLDVRVVQAV